MRIFLVIISLLFLYPGISCSASQDLMGISVDNTILKQTTIRKMDSLMKQTRFFSTQSHSSYISHRLTHDNPTADFYLILFLCCCLGLIRTLHPKFFNDLWRAFINPTLGNGQLRPVIQSASFANLLMNVFSSVVLGTYLFYLVSSCIDWHLAAIPRTIVAGGLILFTLFVYLGKYLLIQLSGWAFQLRQPAELYLYNVFLVNKILSIVLLPVIIFFAFSEPHWIRIFSIASLFIILLFILNRYIRSWRIAAPVFSNSAFHFFMYLCAFELLPVAVFLKLANQML